MAGVMLEVAEGEQRDRQALRALRVEAETLGQLRRRGAALVQGVEHAQQHPAGERAAGNGPAEAVQHRIGLVRRPHAVRL